MKIKEALQKYPEPEAELLLSHILKKSKEFLYLNPGIKLAPEQVSRLSQMMKKRKKGFPLAYLLGYKYFYGLKVKVNKNVLIPRPETELLVDKALELIKQHKLKSVLDIGTGSGNIIISIGKKHPKLKLTGSEVSKKALLVAKQNAKLNKPKVKFIQSNLLNKVKQNFDLIIANLPYLDKRWETSSIKHEPKKALFTKEKGLALISNLLLQISAQKKKPKFVLLEFDPRQKISLNKLVREYLPKASLKYYRDYGGHWRLVVIELW